MTNREPLALWLLAVDLRSRWYWKWFEGVEMTTGGALSGVWRVTGPSGTDAPSLWAGKWACAGASRLSGRSARSSTLAAHPKI